MNYDFLIVGQGIAGSVISSLLYQQGKTFLVVDNNWDGSASKIAAGLYNPIVFKRIVKSWRVDDLLPAMDLYYSDMEAMLNASFFHKKNILKVFVNEAEKEQWFKRAADPEYISYLSKELIKLKGDIINYNNGAAEVLQAGYLDTLTFIGKWKEFISNNGFLINELFSYSDLHLLQNEVEYKGRNFKQVIFCEGHQATQNPYFNYLPFVLTKGDLLKVHIPQCDSNYIINKSVFVLPLDKWEFKIGSTYQWQFTDDKPGAKEQFEIEEKLKLLLKVPFKTLEHTAGIRPTVKDRRPFLGRHPRFNQLAIFNGLGTKGVMLAPFFAHQLLNFLINNAPLEKEVGIGRFNYNDV